MTSFFSAAWCLSNARSPSLRISYLGVGIKLTLSAQFSHLWWTWGTSQGSIQSSKLCEQHHWLPACVQLNSWTLAVEAGTSLLSWGIFVRAWMSMKDLDSLISLAIELESHLREWHRVKRSPWQFHNHCMPCSVLRVVGPLHRLLFYMVKRVNSPVHAKVLVRAISSCSPSSSRLVLPRTLISSINRT